MARRETQTINNKFTLIALHPNQQRHRMLRLLKDAPRARTKNFLYVNSSLACLRTGRTRTISTYGTKSVAALSLNGMVEHMIVYPTGYNHNDMQTRHKMSHKIRSYYVLTQAGLAALAELDRGETVHF